MIPRQAHQDAVRRLLARNPIVTLLGARQVGKTTLARAIAREAKATVDFLDLEDPRTAARLADPMLALERARGLVILDEVQRVPSLFEPLRVLADRRPTRARFLLLGSASSELVRHSSESLAGRVAFHELPGLTLEEVGEESLDRLWTRGGLPRSFTARTLAQSVAWRADFLRTFLERDLPGLGVGVAPTTMRRFWTMLAHWHGQVWNASEFGRAFGVADTTVRKYLDLLAGAFVVRVLPPWHENLAKRQVKAPKVYVRDSGIVHSLLGLPTQRDLESHPKVGASWEGFGLEMVVARLGAAREECFFWATHGGAELDLLVVRGRRRMGFEFKRTSAPHVTPSMRAALADLGLERIDVIHAGAETFPLASRVRAVAMRRLTADVAPL